MKVVGKRTLLLFLTLVLTVGLAAFVWAQAAPKGPAKGGPQGAPQGMMWHGHHGFMNLTPDQAGKIFDAKEKFRNDTAALRKQLVVGRAEMAALWKAENPDEKAIEGKLKELMDLRAQLMVQKLALHFEIRKIAPHAFMQGMWGRGHGWGHGGPGGPGMEPMAPAAEK
ncbi:MAG: Spy/CpxP family protein refolding chaperone [Desulfobaccales bacterium]